MVCNRSGPAFSQMRGRNPRPAFRSFLQPGPPELAPFLGALGELNPQNELQPALAPDRNQILVKGMVSNPNLRSASVAPKTNGLVAAKLAELFGQTILGFLFCLHAISSVLE
jgi:hypothetical protein